MRVHVGDPELVPQMLEFFEEQADCVVLQVGQAELEVSLLGSFRREVHDEKVERLVAEFRRRLDVGLTNGDGPLFGA